MSVQESLQGHPLRPPAPPWLEFRPTGTPEGVLSFYYSEGEAAVPIRAITLANNNKSDPNIETGTYGLFSTCSQRTRSGIVDRQTRYMFFVTQRDGGRMLTGYYRLKWYARGNLPGNDFAVAADRVHFIHPGLPLNDLPESVLPHCAKHFRLSLRVDAAITRVLLELLNSRPNQLAQYLIEVDRLERRNMYRTDFRYVAWRRTEPFTWNDAKRYLPRTEQLALMSRSSAPQKTESRSGKWRCTACAKVTPSGALLKICPWCDEPGTLVEHIES